MKFLENTFLYRLYRGDKKLFAVIAIYLNGFLLYSFIEHEQFPFLFYGMYPEAEQPRDTFTTWSVVIDGKEVDYSRLKVSQRELMRSTISNTAELLKQGNLTKEQKAHFEKWLFTYSVDMRGLETNRMEIYALTCVYDSNGKPDVINKELRYQYVTD